MQLLFLALAPVAAILAYIYYRDKVDKEPAEILVPAFLYGAFAFVPILIVELILNAAGDASAPSSTLGAAFYQAFVVFAVTEEAFKFLALFLVTWRSRHFDQRFDGIVYAVFVSLGFAAAENIAYVFQHGSEVGFLRAFTAVPSHAADGVAMGYFYSLAKFEPERRARHLKLALAVPILLHGFYDFCILSENGLLLALFVPFLIFTFRVAFIQMKLHADDDLSVSPPGSAVPTSVPALAPHEDAERRLRSLAGLRKDGLITAEEFEAKKQVLLQCISQRPENAPVPTPRA